MKYPNYKEYESVYKRYFLKGCDHIINKVSINRDDKILVVTHGGIALSIYLKKSIYLGLQQI